MEQFEYVFTTGMDEAEVERRLERSETGVLSLARDGDAYGIPVAYLWADGAFVFRLADHEDSEKMAFLESTDRASFLVYDADSPERSWSVLAVGPVRELPAECAATIRQREDFVPLRVFGEPVEDLEPRLYELVVERLTGRKVDGG